MDSDLHILRTRQDRAARRMLAIEGWSCPHSAITWAIETMIGNSERSTVALGWLLKQMRALPDQGDADARLADLTLAIAALANAQAHERRRNREQVLSFAPAVVGVATSHSGELSDQKSS